MQPLRLHLGGWGNATIFLGAPEARSRVMQQLGLHFGEWGNATILPGAPEARSGMKSSSRDKITRLRFSTRLRLNAPIGAMRRKARQNNFRGRMQAQMYTRPEVSTSLLATGRGFK